MKSRWSDEEAAELTGPLGPRVYTSRLLGRDKSLVLHGGGNTSVKLREKDVFGVERDVLYVKGSGSDLENINAAGFAPLPLLVLQKLPLLPSLSDGQMLNELNTHVLRAFAPSPSVETLLHAILPTSMSITPTPTRCWRFPTRPTASSASATSTASASR